ncbi:glycosyltransferase [Desulfobaculum bizertense]|uniref:CgeB family protein n=1 Tax=Desulfobaculum bizertense TaxID=376490 RepID=UPI001F41B2C5|nr:glycosyltransferase [Desulfobaculum bizertense]UIJ38816.1 glycosyltransferase [Desulfobaculum bizertense]
MNSSLRILIVLPMYGGSLPIGHYCARALRRMGHLVEIFEAPEFLGAYESLSEMRISRDKVSSLQNGLLNVVSQAILAKAESFEPDLVLSMAQAPLSIPTLRRLKRDNVTTAMWFVEDYKLMTYWKGYAPYYDFFAVIQEEQIFEKLEQIGQENVLYLPLAADPEFHKPMDLTAVERQLWGSELSFMGAGYANRRVAFHQFAGKKFKLWGNGWEDDAVLAPHVQLKGRRLSSEECIKVFNATVINLNLHSSVHVDKLVSGGDFVNPRTFELAACGAFQLVDERSLMSELFYSDELATFETLPELHEKIEYFLANPEERQAFVQRARERVLKDHTYDQRMQTLLDFIASRRSGWPARKQSESALAGLPPELKVQVLELLQRLQLPVSTRLEDLLWAMRQQKGTLTELETSLLFLNEWRQQYGGIMGE